jgi:hypothetical protein
MEIVWKQHSPSVSSSRPINLCCFLHECDKPASCQLDGQCQSQRDPILVRIRPWINSDGRQAPGPVASVLRPTASGLKRNGRVLRRLDSLSHSTPTCTLPHVSGSDKTYVDRVEVTWAASPNAASYTVYRATSNYSWVTKTALGTATGTVFNDTTAVSKKTYYYWVKASSAYGTSGFSACDPGYRP